MQDRTSSVLLACQPRALSCCSASWPVFSTGAKVRVPSDVLEAFMHTWPVGSDCSGHFPSPGYGPPPG